MDFSENQATRESFPQDQARVRSEQGSWSNEPGERASYGIPGALANRPPGDPELTDDFQGDDGQQEEQEISRTSEKFARQFELGREVSVTKQAAGSLSRLSVAVCAAVAGGQKPTLCRRIGGGRSAGQRGHWVSGGARGCRRDRGA